MALLVKKSVTAFDLSHIRPGCLLYAKHHTWDTGKAGFVTTAKEQQITVQFHPGIGNVTNHFHISVVEAEAKEWEIRWSFDLSTVFVFNIQEEEVGGEIEP